MRLPGLVFAGILVACKGEPLVWSDPVFTNRPVAPDDSAPAMMVSDSSGCRGSFRFSFTGRFLFSVWWHVQPDSSSLLMVARSSNRSDWAPAVVADSTDHSVRGCARPAPAIAADSASGYIHVAYFLESAAGAGVFFAHSMNNAATFHSPVPIAFGRNPSRVSVAAMGDRVIVAYEDPNAQQRLIDVALSSTMGHLFESRLQATMDNGNAASPIVRLGNDSIFLWWVESSRDPFGGTTRPAYRAATWR